MVRDDRRLENNEVVLIILILSKHPQQNFKYGINWPQAIISQ